MGTCDTTLTRLQLLRRQAVASPGNANISLEPGARPQFWSQHHQQTSTVNVKVWVSKAVLQRRICIIDWSHATAAPHVLQRHFGNDGVLDTKNHDADRVGCVATCHLMDSCCPWTAHGVAHADRNISSCPSCCMPHSTMRHTKQQTSMRGRRPYATSKHVKSSAQRRLRVR